jgi:hypothetical protein
MILAAAALGGLLVASSTSRAGALVYTRTDTNLLGSLPRSTGVFSLDVNNPGQSVWSYGDSTGRAFHDPT